MNKIVFTHISLFFANLIYALNYTFSKDVMPDFIQPSGFVLLRVIGAVILFSISYFVFVREKAQTKDLIHFEICGVFGVAINQLLFFEGLNLTTPINAAIILTTNPVLVIVISFFIIKESIAFRKGLGIIGASALILHGGNFRGNANFMLGNVFVFSNPLSYRFYLV